MSTPVRICRDHGREQCTAPRCQVLALCVAEASEASARSWRWLRAMGYEHPDNRPLLEQQFADRLVAWMRWPGTCSECVRIRRTTGCWSCRRGVGIPQHPLDELLPYHERIRALSSTCPVCNGVGYHRDIVSPEGRDVPCDPDWATVLVFLDWLADHGWTWQAVHEWRGR